MDQSRQDAEFQVGDQVFQSTQHLSLASLDSSSPKLIPRFVGPIPITRVLSPVEYVLKLQPSFKCHPVFHISLLKPVVEEPELFTTRQQLCPPPRFSFNIARPSWLWSPL